VAKSEKQSATARLRAMRERARIRWRALHQRWMIFWRDIWRENVPKVMLILLAWLAVAAIVVGVVEIVNGTPLGGVIDALYWAVVTASTTGYGDLTPKSETGRALTIVFILVSIAITAVFTATLASVFTAKKIKEGRGLEKIKATDQVVLCGWSRHLDGILKFLSFSEPWRRRAFVLINASPEGQINELLYRFNHLELYFVHGDATQESVLRRASVERATVAILLADELVGDPAAADNLTLQAALAMREINPDIKLIAEARLPESEQHLRRADVDDIIVSGEFSGYMIGSSAASPGLHSAIRELFTVDIGNSLFRNPIPDELRGKTFADAHRHFRQRGALLVGIITEEPGLALDDVLVDDFSQIDRFIRSAFTAAGRDLSVRGQGRSEVKLNPSDDRVIGPNDDAIIIAPRSMAAA